MGNQWWIDFSFPVDPADYRPEDRQEYITHRWKKFNESLYAVGQGFVNVGLAFSKSSHAFVESIETTWDFLDSDPVKDIRVAFSKLPKRPLVVLSDDYEMRITKLDEAMTKAVLIPPQTPLERKAARQNHGPRKGSTFDHQGRRRH